MQTQVFRSGLSGPPPLRPRARTAVRNVQVCAMHCPYTTLGVPPTADEREVKAAYRRLALKFHPDLNKAVDAERRFLTIQEAYEILSGRSAPRHSATSNSRQHADWEFHDWFWAFNHKRRWQAQHSRRAGDDHDAAAVGEPGASSAPPPPPPRPQSQGVLRSQLAGLRQRAAIRNVKRQGGPAGGAPHEAQPPPPGREAARQSDLDYDTTEMGDGVNLSSGSCAAGASPQRRPGFTATEDRKAHVMGQLAGLKRRAGMKARMDAHAATSTPAAADDGGGGAAPAAAATGA